MKIKKFVFVIAVLAMLLSGFSSPSPVMADWSKVDQRVLEQIELNGTAEFHVVMAFQADTSAAATLKTKVEKTTYVFNLLTRTAETTQAPLLAQLKADGVQYESHYIYNFISVTAGRSTVEWLASRPEVARIVSLPDPRKEPLWENIMGSLYGPALPAENAATSSQSPEAIEWNITRIGAPEVWATGNHGEGMVVGDNDTGVQYNHPALVNQYRGNLGGGTFNHNYNWWGGAGSTVPQDWDTHGTHTMGTMVGDDGGSNQIGVAPGAEWIACAGLGGSDVVVCFEFFLAPWDLNHQNPDPTKAPDSINNSWYDTSGYDYRPIILNLNAAGVAVIKSAGNWGSGCSTISPPGNVPEIIATAAFGQGDVIASFSSRGPDSTYGSTILKPEVAAPGVSVRSSIPTNNYGSMSGTSMAAPHSTALVTLIWSAATCIQGDVPLTKQIMMETAEEKISNQCPPFVAHPNDVWGWGILDAPAAVAAAVAYCEAGVRITPPSLEQDGAPGAQVIFNYTIENLDDATQNVTLALTGNQWPTSVAASTGALAPGASVVVPVTVDIPLNPEYILGSDTFTLTATGEVDGDDTATGTTNAVVNLGVGVDDPAGGSGEPLDVVSYDFTVTNLGDYPDSFSLDASGVWLASLPGGTNTGLLDPAESATVVVEVTVPADVEDGDTDVTTLTATSDIDPATSGSASVTTTAIVYSLTIEPSTQEKLGDLGDTVDFGFTVTNSTNVVQDVSLSVSGNSWLTELPATTGDLGVGESALITVTVTVPLLPQAVVGSDTFTLLAEGAVKGDSTATGTTLANATPAVELAAPTGQSAWPLDTLTYEFSVTNTGNYTDAFTLQASGVWSATLPGGNDTGPLAPGASVTVLVLVDIPSGIAGGSTDLTSLTATSQLDDTVFSSADVSTQALYFGILPIMLK